MKSALKETINLPSKSVKQLFNAMNIFESVQDEIEDFLISRNKRIINEIKKAREEHLKGKTKDFRNFIEKYV